MHQCKLLANIHVIHIPGQNKFKEGLIIEDFFNLVLLSESLHLYDAIPDHSKYER